MSSRSTRARASFASSWACVAALAAGLGACGNGAVGVGACRQIEEARCRRAPACNVSLTPPQTTTGDPVNECIRAYDVACLHGLAVSDPGAVAVNACVNAIDNDPDCKDVVKSPQSFLACAWLSPPAATPVVDAASVDSAAAADATSTTAADATGGADASDSGADATSD